MVFIWAATSFNRALRRIKKMDYSRKRNPVKRERINTTLVSMKESINRGKIISYLAFAGIWLLHNGTYYMVRDAIAPNLLIILITFIGALLILFLYYWVRGTMGMPIIQEVNEENEPISTN